MPSSIPMVQRERAVCVRSETRTARDFGGDGPFLSPEPAMMPGLSQRSEFCAARRGTGWDAGCEVGRGCARNTFFELLQGLGGTPPRL